MPNNFQTYKGRVQDANDAAILIQAAIDGTIPVVSWRLTALQRSQISSGDVFVYNKHESKIMRWTDGKLWSPSRIAGPFLIYKEAEEKRQCTPTDVHFNSTIRLTKSEHSQNTGVFASQKGVFYLKENGLIKKTLSIMVNGASYNLVAYCSVEDIDSPRFPRPCEDPHLANVQLSRELQNVSTQQSSLSLGSQPLTRSRSDETPSSHSTERSSHNDESLPLKKRRLSIASTPSLPSPVEDVDSHRQALPSLAEVLKSIDLPPKLRYAIQKL
ncbi:hypothetical protein MP228_005227 [Amoeboaphelidium protococcarum]|nr:hypothetical protein MP228_005227 [Amoeboaphelidium protococcarum]